LTDTELITAGLSITSTLLTAIAIRQGAYDEYAHWPGVDGPKMNANIVGALKDVEDLIPGFMTALVASFQ
jgi:hypothetical protein